MSFVKKSLNFAVSFFSGVRFCKDRRKQRPKIAFSHQMKQTVNVSSLYRGQKGGLILKLNVSLIKNFN